MPANFTLTLDTTAPDLVALGWPAFTNTRDMSFGVAASGGDVAQIKVWGDVDPTVNPNIQATEAASSWIAYSAAVAVRLLAGDGLKTVNARVRDDVWNESGVVSNSTTLDTSAPVVAVTGPDVPKISRIAGKRVAAFSFTANQDTQFYKVKVVPAVDSLHDAGTQIGTGNGSTNMGGAGVAAGTAINSTIDGRDLFNASLGDGDKIIKVFVSDFAGNWSV